MSTTQNSFGTLPRCQYQKKSKIAPKLSKIQKLELMKAYIMKFSNYMIRPKNSFWTQTNPQNSPNKKGLKLPQKLKIQKNLTKWKLSVDKSKLQKTSQTRSQPQKWPKKAQNDPQKTKLKKWKIRKKSYKMKVISLYE